MARNDPPPPSAADDPSGRDRVERAEDPPAASGEAERAPGRADFVEDPLRRLEERLDRASAAAERLIAEAAAQSAARAESALRRPPPAGWQVPRSEDEPARNSEAELLMHIVESLRELVPPDLQRRLAEALRELLLAVRALINWYLERLELQREAPAEPQDIPISWD